MSNIRLDQDRYKYFICIRIEARLCTGVLFVVKAFSYPTSRDTYPQVAMKSFPKREIFICGRYVYYFSSLFHETLVECRLEARFGFEQLVRYHGKMIINT